MFQSPFSFKGRIRRSEYGITYLVYIVTSYLVGMIAETDPMYAIIGLIVFLPIIWLLISQGAKRCHDRGNSGWYQIIPFYALWMLFAESDYGDNAYGPNPKGEGNVAQDAALDHLVND